MLVVVVLTNQPCHSQLSTMMLTELPSELFSLKHVKELRLYNNNLNELPSEIAQLTKLELLHVCAKCGHQRCGPDERLSFPTTGCRRSLLSWAV